MTHRLTLIALLSLLQSTAWAADPCETQSNTVEMNACAKQRFDEQDKLLNTTYNALVKTLATTNDPGISGESPRALLIKAQRRWVEFRDADCKAKYQIHAGGTIRNVMFLSCMQERTAQRIKELAPAEWQAG